VLDDLELALDHLADPLHGLREVRDHARRDQVGDLPQRVVVLGPRRVVRVRPARLGLERRRVLGPRVDAEVVDVLLFTDQLADQRLQLARAADVLLVSPLVRRDRVRPGLGIRHHARERRGSRRRSGSAARAVGEAKVAVDAGR